MFCSTKRLEKACFIVKMTGLAIVGRASSDFWKAPLIHVTQVVLYRLHLQALQKMNSGDTPLNTTALLIEKQKTAQSPYVILSGAGQTFSTGWVTSLIVVL